MISDIEYCTKLLYGGSRTFHAASLMMPRRFRDPAAAIYAFCRLADDAVDGDGDAKAALAELRDRLDRIYRGNPEDRPEDRAFASTVAAFQIPKELPEALLEGFEWDSVGRRYETISDLRAYAVRVAGTVGAMMTLVMRRRNPEAVARAIDLGVAMQLTNIARDIGEDARAGRLYLPGQWLREASIDGDAFLRKPSFGPALGELVKRLLDEAQLFYHRSVSGIALLPAGCRPAIHAARILYAEIGKQVERNGFDSVSQRAVVSGATKLLQLPRVFVAATRAQGTSASLPLSEGRYLTEAVGQQVLSQPINEIETIPWWRIGARTVWVIELFERLESRQQLNRVNS